MRCAVLAVLAAVCVLSVSASPLRSEAMSAASAQFARWKAVHNRAYASPDAEATALSTFTANLRRIEQLNDGEPDQPFALTKFADMTPEEFKAKMLMPKGRVELMLADIPANVADTSRMLQDIPKSFDWRDQGNFVTPVKNQGQCGSCWAFSATENIESVWAIKGKHPLVELSVQQIVSCDTVDQGCNGGDLPPAFKYVMSSGGLQLESDYPYTSGGGSTGKCQYDRSKAVANITGFSYATRNKNETAMQIFMQSQAPLAICVDAMTWQFYNKGIIQKNCGVLLDHCVQLTGWGEENNIPYWNIRNSWGESWGENGYIRVERNKNLCGVAKEAISTYI